MGRLLTPGRRRAGLVLLAGAGLYALLVGALGVSFAATPLLLGVIALIAGLLGPSEGALPPALGLLGWGAAALLVLEGPIPDDRAAPAYLIGAGAGMLAASVVSRTRRRAAPASGAAAAVLIGGLGLYLTYDETGFADWPIWMSLLALWGLVEIVRGSMASSAQRRRV